MYKLVFGYILFFLLTAVAFLAGLSGPAGNALATLCSRTAQVGPSVFAKVLSARSGAEGADMTLQIEDYGALDALEV